MLQKELHGIVSGGTAGAVDGVGGPGHSLAGGSSGAAHSKDGSLLAAVLHDPSMAAAGGAVLATYQRAFHRLITAVPGWKNVLATVE